MATILYGNEWLGDAQPTSGVVAGQSWVQPTSGAMWRRDTTNSTWIFFGSVNNNLGGAIAASGDTMTGPLANVPNLPPLTNPNFLGTVYEGGFPVALAQDLANLRKELYDQITYQVREQFLSQFQQSQTSSNVAFASSVTTNTVAQISTGTYEPNVPGTVDTIVKNIGGLGNASFVGLSIPLPAFPDGIVATNAQVLGYGYAISGYSIHGQAGNDYYIRLWEVSSRLIGMFWPPSLTPLDSSKPMDVATWILAVR